MAGDQAKVPLMAGWNSAEIKLPPTTVAAFEQQLATAFPQDLDSARLFYPAPDDRQARLSAIALASDGFTAAAWASTRFAMRRSTLLVIASLVVSAFAACSRSERSGPRTRPC